MLYLDNVINNILKRMIVAFLVKTLTPCWLQCMSHSFPPSLPSSPNHTVANKSHSCTLFPVDLRFFFFNSHGSPSRLSYGEEGVKHNSKGVLLVCFAFVITIIMKKKAFSNLCWFHIYRPVILAVSVPAGTVTSLGDCFPSSSQLPPAQRFSRQVDRVTGAEFKCPDYPGQYDHSLSLPPTGEAPLLWWICVHSVSALVKPIHQNDLSK